MGGGAPSIPQRSLGGELGAINKYLPKFTQTEFKLGQQYAPKYSALDLKTLQQYAPQYLGLNLAEMQKNIAGQPLLKGLNEQANTELANAGHLTDQEAYQRTQGTLGAFSGRNNVFNQAEAQSFLDRDALVRQRAGEARSFATGVQQLNTSQLGALGGISQPGGAFAPMGAGLGAVSGVSGPLMNYASDVYSSNQNAEATQNIAASNKSGGMAGAGIGAAGAIGGAAIAAL